MTQQIRLQGIGWVNAIPASELQVGDITVWNYGGYEEVILIEPTKSGKSVKVTLAYGEGKQAVRTMRVDRLVAIQPRKVVEPVEVVEEVVESVKTVETVEVTERVEAPAYDVLTEQLYEEMNDIQDIVHMVLNNDEGHRKDVYDIVSYRYLNNLHAHVWEKYGYRYTDFDAFHQYYSEDVKHALFDRMWDSVHMPDKERRIREVQEAQKRLAQKHRNMRTHGTYATDDDARIVELERMKKAYNKAVEDARKWSERRRSLPAGSTRARITTANARWAQAAEHRDHLEKRIKELESAQ